MYLQLPGGGGGGYIRDMRPKWVSFPGQKPADECKFLTKNLRMGHNSDTIISIILPGNGWFSSKLNKTYCSLFNFDSCSIVNSLRMGLFSFIDRPTLVCRWVNFQSVNTPVQTKLK